MSRPCCCMNSARGCASRRGCTGRIRPKDSQKPTPIRLWPTFNPISTAVRSCWLRPNGPMCSAAQNCSRADTRRPAVTAVGTSSTSPRRSTWRRANCSPSTKTSAGSPGLRVSRSAPDPHHLIDLIGWNSNCHKFLRLGLVSSAAVNR